MRKHTAAPVHQEARVLGEPGHFLFLSVPTDDSLGDSALVVLLQYRGAAENQVKVRCEANGD